MAAECVAREKGNRGFWVFIQAVFEQTRGGGGGVPDLKAAVDAAGPPWDTVSACMNGPEAGKPGAEDIQKARAHGISGTPATVILDNKTGEHHLVQGLRNAQDILNKIASDGGRRMKTITQENKFLSSAGLHLQRCDARVNGPRVL